MAAPAVTACAVGVYTKVATGVTSLRVFPLDGNNYVWTYRLTAAGAPTLVTEAADIHGVLNNANAFVLSASSDVYIWNQGPAAGNVRVDT